MAEDSKNKSRERRQKIAQLKQRAKVLVLSKSRAKRDQALRTLEILADIEGKITEQALYQERGNQDLADHFDPEITAGLDSEDQNISEAEEMPAEEDEEDDSSQDQPDNQQDDQRQDRKKDDKRPQEREKQSKSKPEREPSTTKAKPTTTAPKPVAKPPMPAGGIGAGAGAGAEAGGAAGARAGLAALAKTPQFWIVIGIIAAVLLLIFLLVWLAGGMHKSFNESGGSFPITLNHDDAADRDLVIKVQSLRDGGALVLDDGIAGDIDWQDDGKGNLTHKLDWRVMVTLKYLAQKWQARTSGVIGVRLLASNAPESTRRKAVMKIFGATLGANNGEEPLDAPSAYATGQGIGIETIGRVSNELASACFNDSDGDQSNNAPVQVAWQEVTSEATIRPAYEQLQVDSKQVFEELKVLQGLAQQAKKSPAELKRYNQSLTAVSSIYTTTGVALDNLLANLQTIRDLQNKGIDQRTRDYAISALSQLSPVRDATRSDILAWDTPAIIKSVRDGLEETFRMMQVANMVGWKNPAKPNCRLWQAYEARENIRRLVLDLEQMPADPALVDADSNWNSDLMVRQLIVYSPEDDLDNGLSDMDVFPKGAISVDEGGVGYDDTDKDGVANYKDNQFMALPIDNGVFSKASTIFVYKMGIVDVAKDLALNTATGGAAVVLDQLHDLFSGSGTSTYSGENLQKVTYKNFVHIGF